MFLLRSRRVYSGNFNAVGLGGGKHWFSELKREAKVWALRPEDQIPLSLKPRMIQVLRQAKPILEHTPQGCGEKYNNLVKLGELLDRCDLPRVIVPLPQSVGHAEIQAFLEQAAPRVFEQWHFLRTLSLVNEPHSKFLEQKKVQQALQNIEEAIKEAFERASRDSALATSFLSAGMQTWMASLHERQRYLMVRSSGAEDSELFANAGGNRSLSYVQPLWQDVCLAMGEVVASYFGIDSLHNQLNMGINPFLGKVHLAILLQELIGEPVGGASDISQIPRSLVLFTKEAWHEGSDRFRVMRLSATYGHGEAVVQQLGVACDTAYLLRSLCDPSSLYMVYNNKDKHSRKAPLAHPITGRVQLQDLPNDPNLKHQRVFDEAMLRRLYALGEMAETLFDGNAADLEIIVLGDVIYPVQVRPIVQMKAKPTYLKLAHLMTAKRSPLIGSISAQLLVAGKMGVVTIHSAHEILYASSLRVVEENQLFKKGQHLLVVVAEEEPVNSHGVVNFSGYGIPCLIADGAAFKKLAEALKEGHILVVCVQTATFHLWKRQEGISPQDYIVEGFISHPAKLAISLKGSHQLPKLLSAQNKPPKKVVALLQQLKSASTATVAGACLDQLKKHPWITQFEHRYKVHKYRRDDRAFAEAITTPFFSTLKELDGCVQRAFEELGAFLPHFNGEDRMPLLFHAKVLSTLLFDNHTQSHDTLHYSVAAFPSHFAALEIQLAYQRKLRHPALFLKELLWGMESPLPNVFDKWRMLLLRLESKPQSHLIQPLKKALTSIKEGGVFPIFLTCFLPSILQTKCPQVAAKSIINLLPEEHTLLIQALFGYKNTLSCMKQALSSFEQPETFSAAFVQLKELAECILPANTPSKGKQRVPRQDLHVFLKGGNEGRLSVAEAFSEQNWQALSPFMKMLLIQVMQECIELYDSAIKSMKGSPAFSDEEKIARLGEMLEFYLNMLQVWCLETAGKIKFVMHPSLTLKGYLRAISSRLRSMLKKPAAGTLHPSRNFSVSAAMLGSGTLFERHYPQHLEDAFTLIHQNLVAVTALLFNQTIADKSFLPEQLLQVMRHVETVGRPPLRAPICTGIEISQMKIILRYNIPLRNHSSCLHLEYDPSDDRALVKMKAQFLGQARERWQMGREMLTFFEAVYQAPIWEIELNQNELSYVLQAKEGDPMPFHLFREIAIISLERDPCWDDFLELFSKEQIASAIVKLFDEDRLPNNLEEILIAFQHKYTLSSCSRRIPELFALLHAPWRFEGVALLVAIARRLKLAIENTLPNSLTELFIQDLAQIPDDKLCLFLKESLRSENSVISDVARQLYTRLLHTGKRSQEVVAAAEMAFSLSTQHVKENGKLLYQALFRLNLGFESAAELVLQAVRRGDYGLSKELYGMLCQCDYDSIWIANELFQAELSKLTGLEFYGMLVDNHKAHAHAAHVASSIFQTKSMGLKIAALKLYEKLLKENQAAEAALKAAEIAWEDDDLAPHALDLFAALVEKGYQVPFWMDIVERGLQLLWLRPMQEGIFNFCDKLMQTGHFVEYILRKYIGHGEWNETTFELYDIYLKYGHGSESATQAAASALLSSEFSVNTQGLRIYGRLVEKECALEDAKSAAISIFKKEDIFSSQHEAFMLRSAALDVCDRLLEKKIGIEELAEVAKVALQGNVDVQILSLKLYHLLVKHGNAYEDAAKAASILCDNEMCQHHVFQLYRELLNKGEMAESILQDALRIHQNAASRDFASDLIAMLFKKGVHRPTILQFTEDWIAEDLRKQDQGDFRLYGLLLLS